MTTKINVKRKRGDTDFEVFRVLTESDCSVVDISNWTDFFLTVDTLREPPDPFTSVEVISGVIIDGPLGRVGFSPLGNLAVGRYFYDVQALNDNGKKKTIAQGRWVIKQDITKI